MKGKNLSFSLVSGLLSNLLLVMVLEMLARIIFIAYNYSHFAGHLDGELLWGIVRGGVRFDLSTLFYLNSLWALLYILPLHLKERSGYHKTLRILFVTVNALALATNLADCVYVNFSGRRTTISVFSEFAHEDNIAKIISLQLLHNWWAVIGFALIIWGVYKLYRMPSLSAEKGSLKGYYLTTILTLLLLIPTAICSIRGGIDRTTRPIAISNANQYVRRPIEAAAVLNTPFSILRSIGKTSYNIKPYMPEAEALKYFTPVHIPADTVKFKPKNVVILIVESFSRGFIGSLNKHLPGYAGYAPCLDQLVSRSHTFTHSFANGQKSIDGMPSILSSIPMMIEPFFLTPAAMNHVGGIACELHTKGYTSAFFHGAPNGSMGFEAFAKSSGWDAYYGKTEFDNSRGAEAGEDFDGTWAIWDEPFLQYYAETMSTMKEPFVTAVFTASSHDPFHVPEKYKSKYPEEGNHPLYKCLRYTDMSLGKFFETASKQPWYKNTIFVLTSDHSSIAPNPFFENDMQHFASPIIFFTPDESLKPELDDVTLAQQIDIMPTVLGLLGYDKPYVAFGCDLFSTPQNQLFTFSYLGGIYQFARGDYFIQFDGEKVRSAYNFRQDPTLQHDLKDEMDSHELESLTLELKSFIQQYAQRMRTDDLLYKENK